MIKYINGPVNYAKLTGKINGITKTINIFMDRHNEIDKQTKCESYNSIDIQHYLYQEIKKRTQPLDFFMEIRKNQLDEIQNKQRDIYMKEVVGLFKSEFVTKDNKTLEAKNNKKVRLHIMDIRDILGLFYATSIIDYDWKEDYEKIIKNEKDVTILNKHLENITKMISNIEKAKTIVEKERKQHANKILYFMNKIINDYTNKELKKIINKFIDYELGRYISLLHSIISQLKTKIKYYENEEEIKRKNVSKFISYVYELLIDIYSIFTDIYLLRRVLDKDYAKNIIIYVGRQHAINYIYFMVKYFGFTIVNVYSSEEKDNKVLEKKIKSSEYMSEIYKLFGSKEKEYQQCIKMPEIHAELVR